LLFYRADALATTRRIEAHPSAAVGARSPVVLILKTRQNLRRGSSVLAMIFTPQR
jgi:hypothetical protein